MLALPAHVAATRPAVAGGRAIHVPRDVPTISAAIAIATDGDEIVVAPGRYREHLEFGKASIAVRSAAGPGDTVLDAAGTGRPALRFDGGASLVDGFTITGGTPSRGGAGAGVTSIGASPVLRRCFIARNAGGVGAAAACDGGDPVFDRCAMYLNGAGPGRGGVLVIDGSPRFDACTFVDEGVRWSGGPPVSIGVGCGRVGACCDGRGCVVATESACWRAGSRFLGPGTTCDDPRCPPACPADVSGDGLVNQSDLLLLLSGWGWCRDDRPP